MRTFLFATLFLLVFSVGTPVASAAEGGAVVTPSGAPSGDGGAYVPPTKNTNSGPVVTIVNPLGSNNCSQAGNCLQSFLTSILQFVVKIGSIIIVLMIVYIGYKFVAAQGKEADIRAAREMLLWTVIGALILLGAEAIAQAIQATVKSIGG